MLHKITLFLFLIFFFQGNAQKIEKVRLNTSIRMGHQQHFSPTDLSFELNGSFSMVHYYNSPNCNPGKTWTGKGKYFIQNDSLILEYDSIPKLKNELKIINKLKSNNDSIIVKLKIFDNHTKELIKNTTDPIEFTKTEIIIYYPQSSGIINTNSKVLKNIYANDLGEFTFKLPKTKDQYFIEFRSIYHNDFKELFSVTAEDDQNIEFFITYKYAFSIANKIEKIPLKKNCEKFIILKGEDVYVFKEFKTGKVTRTYYKKNKIKKYD
jgi:hypothetical protein